MDDKTLSRPRQRLGNPSQGDGTARGGYGREIFEMDGWTCAYCGLLMLKEFDYYLQLSVDHVVPRSTLGCDPLLIEDKANLVTCCRACNEFGNRFAVTLDGPIVEETAFWILRDRVFHDRRRLILERREKELERYHHIRKFTWLPGDIEIIESTAG